MGQTFTRLFFRNLIMLTTVLAFTVFKAWAQPIISYAPNSANYTQGVAITPATLTNIGTAVTAGVTPAVLAQGYSEISGMALDSHGNVYTTSFTNCNITKTTADGSTQTVIAGNGNRSSTDGSGLSASFAGPQGIAIDAQDNIFVIDYENGNVRKIVDNAGDYAVSTFATGFYAAHSMAFGKDGNLYIANYYSRKVDKLTISNGVATGTTTIATYTGSNQASTPYGIAVDKQLNIFVSFLGPSGRIDKISPNGTISVYNAAIPSADAIAIDGAGNLYAGSANGSGQVKRITPDGIATDYVTQYRPGYTLSQVNGLAFDNTGNLIIGHAFPYLLCKVTIQGYRVVTPANVAAFAPGLNIDDATGTISGTPIQFSGPVAYNVLTSDGVTLSTPTTFTISVSQASPAITALTPSVINHTTGGLITLTGIYFGNSPADLTSVTYGPNGTENAAISPVWDSPTQVHFTVPGPVPSGVAYKAKITIDNTFSSPVSTVSFTGDTPPNATYSASTYSYPVGTAVSIVPTQPADAINGTYTAKTIAGANDQSGNADGTGSAASFTFP